MTSALWRTHGARIRWGSVGADPARTVSTVSLENSRLRVTFALSRGCEFVEFIDKKIDVDYCSYSSRGPLPPFTPGPLAPNPVSTFHDSYTGGWQTVFPNGGVPSTYRGAALAQHAEAAVLPWAAEVLLDTPEEVAVSFTVSLVRLPFTLTRIVRLTSTGTGVDISETAHNLVAEPLAAMWGQHITLGPPFLTEGCTITVPDGVRVSAHAGPRSLHPAELWPIVTSDDGEQMDISVVPADDSPSEMKYLSGFTEGWYEIREPNDGNGLRVRWDATVMPYLWLWRELGASKDYPFWGEGRALGLEPFSSAPTTGLSGAVANGNAVQFDGGERKVFDWGIDLATAGIAGQQSPLASECEQT